MNNNLSPVELAGILNMENTSAQVVVARAAMIISYGRSRGDLDTDIIGQLDSADLLRDPDPEREYRDSEGLADGRIPDSGAAAARKLVELQNPSTAIGMAILLDYSGLLALEEPRRDLGSSPEAVTG